ncbi:MAG: hypothetical protein SFT93_01885 [Rickettsiaceae bacterium]|nr:hypothetical protein [Rickettsiaceae bacterium]
MTNLNFYVNIPGLNRKNTRIMGIIGAIKNYFNQGKTSTINEIKAREEAWNQAENVMSGASAEGVAKAILPTYLIKGAKFVGFFPGTDQAAHDREEEFKDRISKLDKIKQAVDKTGLKIMLSNDESFINVSEVDSTGLDLAGKKPAGKDHRIISNEYIKEATGSVAFKGTDVIFNQYGWRAPDHIELGQKLSSKNGITIATIETLEDKIFTYDTVKLDDYMVGKFGEDKFYKALENNLSLEEFTQKTLNEQKSWRAFFSKKLSTAEIKAIYIELESVKHEYLTKKTEIEQLPVAEAQIAYNDDYVMVEAHTIKNSENHELECFEVDGYSIVGEEVEGEFYY